MEQKTFWSTAATQGGVIGLVLAASMWFETYASLSGRVGLMGLMLVEWIVAVCPASCDIKGIAPILRAVLHPALPVPEMVHHI